MKFKYITEEKDLVEGDYLEIAQNSSSEDTILQKLSTKYYLTGKIISWEEMEPNHDPEDLTALHGTRWVKGSYLWEDYTKESEYFSLTDMGVGPRRHNNHELYLVEYEDEESRANFLGFGTELSIKDFREMWRKNSDK